MVTSSFIYYRQGVRVKGEKRGGGGGKSNVKTACEIVINNNTGAHDLALLRKGEQDCIKGCKCFHFPGS